MKEELPGASSALTMGILSIVLTLFCCGPFGAIFSFIGFAKAKSAKKLFEENPDKYISVDSANTGRILSIVGLILACLLLLCILLFLAPILAFIGMAGYESTQYQY
ncbi:CCC motif membrane protein [Cellulophaga fucicola]|uniref:DUF4190 domain-containing protein n=1 Tax=Cellulophaga fucicola TaxID=76595 RepID=A0A1K1N505_9FLAO|nr:CCC motif membrane protein [Cellulophaga fucicola]SFW30488.1 hypothetical protein SAMN05660313_01183 [Cellulophaga fucicola]